MGKILCATRGGEASYRTQDEAIALAKARNDSLIFVYVVDLRFLDKIAGAGIVDTEQELAKMGQFLLTMAQERAAVENVEAATAIRKGQLSDSLKDVAAQEEVDLIVLGRPAGPESVFKMEELEHLASKIEMESGVETRVL